MSKRTIIYLKKTDPENPQRQESIYIHDDLVAKALTGERSSPKVSDIRFDDGPKQEWVAVLRDGRELCRNKDRGTVVQMEADIIAKMFARGEYIPGGYNGEPRHKAPGDLLALLNHFKHLGCHEEFDLYASEESVVLVRSDTKNGIGVITSLEQEVNFKTWLVSAGRGWSDTEFNAIQECARRWEIEQEIEREEAVKTKHHA